VLKGVDYLVEKGIADPNRLGLCGWSAGGTLVNKLITVTDRFKAASSGAGIANWISLMAQTDTLTSRTVWFGGTPWDAGADLNAFTRESPVTNVARVKTPTLFLVGERDKRVPLPQSQEMYRGLQQHGVPTQLIVAPGEEHDGGGWKLKHQFDKANVELGWFEQ